MTAVPLSDANIFPEYILPNLMPLCHDRNDLVRAAFASNISVVNFMACPFSLFNSVAYGRKN